MAFQLVRATVITQMTNVTPMATDFTEPLTFNLFNPTSGVLTGITFRVESTLSGSINIENVDPDDFNQMNYSFEATINLIRPMTNTVLLSTMPSFTNTVVLNLFDGIIDFGGTSGTTIPLNIGATNSLFTMNPIDLALFTGTGTIIMNLGAIGMSTVVDESGKDDPVVQIFSDGGALVTLEYLFIPEPNTLAYIGVAMAFCSFMRRRRK
ncbi:MAG: choice-of-anchor E domain-containing protein [Verrucomicrobiota bacterium]